MHTRKWSFFSMQFEDPTFQVEYCTHAHTRTLLEPGKWMEQFVAGTHSCNPIKSNAAPDSPCCKFGWRQAPTTLQATKLLDCFALCLTRTSQKKIVAMLSAFAVLHQCSQNFPVQQKSLKIFCTKTSTPSFNVNIRNKLQKLHRTLSFASFSKDPNLRRNAPFF